jgi:hypothetical protein
VAAKEQFQDLERKNADLVKQLEDPPWKSERSYQIIMLAAAIDGFQYRGWRSDVPARIADAAARLGLSITAPVVSRHLQQAIEDLETDPAKPVDN